MWIFSDLQMKSDRTDQILMFKISHFGGGCVAPKKEETSRDAVITRVGHYVK